MLSDDFVMRSRGMNIQNKLILILKLLNKVINPEENLNILKF